MRPNPTALVCAGLLCFAPIAASAQTLTRIDVPDALQTVPSGISARGDIVGSYLDENLVEHSFLFAKGIYTTIEIPGATSTNAAGIDAAGDIVGNFVDEQERTVSCCAKGT
jgi:hypothetical protein